MRSPCVRPTVLIVDDHGDFRASARMMLESEGFEVVGEAVNGSDAVIAAGLLSPDIVLLDVQLPDEDGFAIAERLVAEPRSPAVVLISSREASAYGGRVARAAVRGFIPKRTLSGAALAQVVQ